MSWPTTRRHPRTLAEAFPRDFANAIEHHAGHSRMLDKLLDCAAAIGISVALTVLVVSHF